MYGIGQKYVQESHARVLCDPSATCCVSEHLHFPVEQATRMFTYGLKRKYWKREQAIFTVRCSSRDNSPLSEWIAYVFDITVLLVTERILPVFVKEAEVL